jgi:hypothetical protein
MLFTMSLPYVFLGGVSLYWFPGSKYSFSVTFSGGAGPSVQGFARPVAVEGVWLQPGKTSADLGGWGTAFNGSIGASGTAVYDSNGKLVAMQGGVATGIGASALSHLRSTNRFLRDHRCRPIILCRRAFPKSA